jgi:hypothetical protein
MLLHFSFYLDAFQFLFFFKIKMIQNVKKIKNVTKK